MMPGRSRRSGVAWSKDDMVKLLAGVPLFEGLSKKELEAVVGAGKEVDVRQGKQIVAEGQTGLGFHLVLEGSVRVLVGGEDRAQLGPGEYFGEMSLIDGGPRSATVVADTPVRTLSLASWAFLPILDDHPSIARKLLVELSRRLRSVEQSIRH
jgi:CRP/FNR family cyclic AMP-dependent transcriptional regulator